MSKKIFIIFAFVLLIAGIALVASPSKKQDQKEIILGGIYSLSGDNAVLGQAEKNASLLAIEEINASGGINDVPLRVIWEDGKCSGKDGLTAAQKLVSIDKVRIILAGGCSSEVLGFAPLTEKAKVVTMDITGTSPEITHAGEYIFRNVPSDAFSGSILAEYAIGKGYRRAAILSEQTDYAKALRDVFQETFGKQGREIIVAESFGGSERDVRTQVTKIKASGPDVLFLNTQSLSTAIMAAQQIRELGVGVPLLATEIVLVGDQKDFLNAKEHFEGAVISQLDFGAVDQSRLDVFNKNYQERFGNV